MLAGKRRHVPAVIASALRLFIGAAIIFIAWRIDT
jgi:hypothetical protein